MKTINPLRSALRLFPIPAALLFLSCSADSTLPVNGTDAVSHESLKREGRTMPFNDDNAHDSTGELYVALLSSYYENANLPQDIAGIVGLTESTAVGNVAFNALKSVTYHAPDPNRIAYLLAHPTTSVQEVLDDSELGAAAQSRVSNFITSMAAYVAQDESPETIYDSIVAFEREIKDHPQMSLNDKEIILITTSIARHSAHFRKKRPKKNTDPDWDWLTLSIVGAVEGAGDGEAEAITMSLACGIVENR